MMAAWQVMILFFGRRSARGWAGRLRVLLLVRRGSDARCFITDFAIPWNLLGFFEIPLLNVRLVLKTLASVTPHDLGTSRVGQKFDLG